MCHSLATKRHGGLVICYCRICLIIKISQMNHPTIAPYLGLPRVSLFGHTSIPGGSLQCSLGKAVIVSAVLSWLLF